MDKVYIYCKQEDFYLSDHLKADEELLREDGCRDRLYGEYDSEEELVQAIMQLFNEGLYILPAAENIDVVKMYCPPELIYHSRKAHGTMIRKNSHMLYSECTEAEVKKSLLSSAEGNLLYKYRVCQDIDPMISRRIEEERRAVEASGNLLDIAVLYEISQWMRQAGQPFWLIGASGSSFLFYLLEITRCNPLPPKMGCGGLYSDGQDIPWQILWHSCDPSYFEVRLPVIMRDEFNDWLENHWLFRLCPNLTLDRPTPERIHFAHIQLNFVLEGEQLSSSKEWTAADVAEKVTGYWRELVIGGSDKIAQRLTEFGDIPEPQTFSDVIYLYGLLHAEGAWDDQTAKILAEQGRKLPEMIAFRDDVFQYLKRHGFSDAEANHGERMVSYGHGLPEITDEMKNAEDSWVLDRCRRIKYLFPKANVIEYFLFKIGYSRLEPDPLYHYFCRHKEIILSNRCSKSMEEGYDPRPIY